MTDSTRQMGDPSDIHSQRTVFSPRQAEQSENSGADNPGERHGTYEPDDSRNVTGAGGSGVGAPGGSDQQMGGERWGGGQQGQSQTPNAAGEVGSGSAGQMGQSMGQSGINAGSQGDGSGGQQSQYDSSSGQQMGEIREHMEVIGADGVRLGTVDQCEGDRIKLTKADSGMGSHEGHHHYISRGLVAGVEGDRVRLSANADVAYGMTEEE